MRHIGPKQKRKSIIIPKNTRIRKTTGIHSLNTKSIEHRLMSQNTQYKQHLNRLQENSKSPRSLLTVNFAESTKTSGCGAQCFRAPDVIAFSCTCRGPKASLSRRLYRRSSALNKLSHYSLYCLALPLPMDGFEGKGATECFLRERA